MSCEHWDVDTSVLRTMIHVDTWWGSRYLMCLTNIDTLSLALIATEFNITNIESAMHYVLLSILITCYEADWLLYVCFTCFPCIHVGCIL